MCALAKFDKAAIEAAASRAARSQFKDASVLISITKTFETKAGQKLVGNLLRIAPGPARSPVFPPALYTSSEENELRRFLGSSEFAVFQTFAQTVGPQVEKSPAYRAMMSGIKAACMPQGPMYAIYGVEATGENGTIRTLNVGTLPSGIISECQNQISVFEAGIRHVYPGSAVKLIPSSCVRVLPANILPMILEQTLPDAYVVKQSGNWAPVYSAWYGLPRTEPVEVCNRLVEGMRKKLTVSQAEVQCFPPSMVIKSTASSKSD